jgi:hypothetical protein
VCVCVCDCNFFLLFCRLTTATSYSISYICPSWNMPAYSPSILRWKTRPEHIRAYYIIFDHIRGYSGIKKQKHTAQNWRGRRPKTHNSMITVDLCILRRFPRITRAYYEHIAWKMSIRRAYLASILHDFQTHVPWGAVLYPPHLTFDHPRGGGLLHLFFRTFFEWYALVCSLS